MPKLSAVPGLLSVPGFRAMGVNCGLKKERPDLALIVSDTPGTTGAAVFTQNAFAAAPVHVSRQHVADGDVRAIVVNSGNANACTGRQGLRDALAMARTAAEHLGIDDEQVIVASTGIIGRPLAIDKVTAGIADCASKLSSARGDEAARAILTTDSGPKQAHVTFEANGRTYQVAGIAKGAGMIHPNMATMLAFLATDAPVEAAALRGALHTATTASFNQISVDGDESTNDMAVVLASGASGGQTLTPAHPQWDHFQDALDVVTRRLAMQIAADGEGATRLLEVTVEGADDDPSARAAARAIASSNLVKSAIHGSDPNWGRVVAALGATLHDIDPGRVDLHLGDRRTQVRVLASGEPVDEALPLAAQLLGSSEVTVRVVIGAGRGQGQAWGCDLTEGYVTFNSAYTT